MAEAQAIDQGHARRMAPGDVLLLIAISALWGVNAFFWKLVVGELPPLFASALRFAILPLVLFAWLRPPATGRAALLGVALLTGPVHFGLQSIGLAQAHGFAAMAIVMQLWIPASVLLAAIFLRERVSALRQVGIVVAFGGVAVLAADPDVLSQWTAVALVAAASVAYAAAGVLVRTAPAMPPLTFQAWIALVSAPFLFGVSAVGETGQWSAAAQAPWWVWAAILFAAFGSSIWANGAMFRLMQRYEMARTTPFMFLSPLIGVALGVTFLGDPLGWRFVLGAVLTMGGVAFVTLAERRGQ